jgi:hypothetical protein
VQVFYRSNWTEPSAVGIIERVRLVKVKELGNGTCSVLRETETGEIIMKLGYVFKMFLSNISVL